jgi:hypothetical protein
MMYDHRRPIGNPVSRIRQRPDCLTSPLTNLQSINPSMHLSVHCHQHIAPSSQRTAPFHTPQQTSHHNIPLDHEKIIKLVLEKSHQLCRTPIHSFIHSQPPPKSIRSFPSISVPYFHSPHSLSIHSNVCFIVGCRNGTNPAHIEADVT